jgi:hypothetical protein
MGDTGAWPLATRYSGPVSDRGAGPRAITHDCFAEDRGASTTAPRKEEQGRFLEAMEGRVGRKAELTGR